MHPDDRHPPDGPTARRPVRRWAGPLCVLLLAGCRGLGKNDQRYDALEAELRTRERELIETRAERDRLKQLADLYGRSAPVPPGAWAGGPVFHPGTDAPTLPVRSVELGRGTGGVDEDGRPGDESLMAVVIPRDDDGTAVKVPARVTVLAWEVSPQGIKTPIGKWEVGPDQLRRTWRSGLLSSGYFVPLQWDKAPCTERVRVAVRLVTLDGQGYEADRDVTVRPLPGVGPGPTGPATIPPPAVPLPRPDVPPGAEELPPPPGRPAAKLLPATPGGGR